jgi:hypothetical protein
MLYMCMIANIEHIMLIYILPYSGTHYSRLTKPKLDVPTRYYIVGTKPAAFSASITTFFKGPAELDFHGAVATTPISPSFM